MVAIAKNANPWQKNAAEKRKAHVPTRVDDLLNSYLKLLSKIPLFKAEEEKEAASQLHRFELETWQSALHILQAVEYLLEREPLDEFPAIEQLNRLARRYTRGGIASGSAPRRATIIDREIEYLANELREYDKDREIIERTVGLIRTCRPDSSPGIKESKRRGLPPGRAERSEANKVERAFQKALNVRNKFVRANLRLVVSVARGFHHYRLPLVDLIQEGNLGLIKAVHRYDHRKGFRFSTYAHWWIRQSIERAIVNKGSQVRLPVHVFDTRRQVARAQRELTSGLGRTPTADEIAESLEISVDKVTTVQSGMGRDPVSLDDMISDSDDRNLGEVLFDSDSPQPEESVMKEAEVRQVRELLALLSPIEMDVICRRFGLMSDNDETLEEIGKKYNLSRERVRQIQVQGLKKMRRFCERREIGAESV